MTPEEAIETLKKLASFEGIVPYIEQHGVTVQNACYAAIEALQAPCFTSDELRLMRKVLSCVNTLYTVAEPEYRENKIDLLLRKLREMEENNA